MLRTSWKLMGLAALLLALAAGNAHAVSGITISPGGAMEWVSSGSLTIEGEERREVRVSCAFTLRGTMESALVGITGEGARIGAVTGISWSGCTGAEIEGVLNLPWSIVLQKLDRVNPRIAVAESLSEVIFYIKEPSISFSRLGAGTRCLYGGVGDVIPLAASLSGSPNYTVGTSSVLVDIFNRSGVGCPLVARISGSFSTISPSQTLRFLAGGEVREAVTPNPVEFGNVGSGGLAQRTVTISSTRGGRIEEISVRTGRYFAITDPNTCRGRTISAGASCSFRAIVSAPSETGRELTDNVIVRLATRSFEATLRAST